jgi:hypothetical protein
VDKALENPLMTEKFPVKTDSCNEGVKSDQPTQKITAMHHTALPDPHCALLLPFPIVQQGHHG